MFRSAWTTVTPVLTPIRPPVAAEAIVVFNDVAWAPKIGNSTETFSSVKKVGTGLYPVDQL